MGCGGWSKRESLYGGDDRRAEPVYDENSRGWYNNGRYLGVTRRGMRLLILPLFKGFHCLRWVPITLVLATVQVCASPVTIVDNGDPTNRVDIVFLGDGYTQADHDAGEYDQHIQSYLDHMFASPTAWDDPFPRYEKFFNVHKIDVVSNQSGADIPLQSIFVDTALNASYTVTDLGSTNDRLLLVTSSIANSIRNRELAGTGITADMQLITVNHTKYGGSGGSWATFAGGDSAANEIALHELGHSFADLTDEYFSSGTYTGSEPSAPNATRDPSGAKWSHWKGFDDPRGSNLDIGVFQGARGYSTGIWRPSANSKMRNLNRPFDAVSREAIIHEIYEHVAPLDGWLDNSVPLSDVDLSVDVVDPEVIKLKWYVDEELVPGATTEAFHAADFGFGPGTYNVRAHAYDGVIDHAFAGGLLDLVRTRLDLLQQEISWILTLTAVPLAGDYNENGIVDASDFLVWRDSFGQSGTGLAADGDDSGTIDTHDYDFWKARFGNAAAGISAGQMASSIPEPPTVMLVSAMLVTWGGLFPNRRSPYELT